MALPTTVQSQLGLKMQRTLDPTVTSMIEQGRKMEESGSQRIAQGLQKKTETMAPLQEKMGGVEQTLAQTPVPPETQLPETFKHEGMSPEELKSSMSTMMAFAAIGGLMTRAPMTAALNAFSGALQGYIKGDNELFKRESQVFDRNMKLAVEKGAAASRRYRDIVAKANGDLGIIQQQMRLAATEFNDTVTLAQLDQKTGRDLLTQGISLQKSTDQATTQMERMRMMFDMQSRKLDAQERRDKAMIEANQMRANAAMLRAQNAGTGTAEKPLTENERKTGLFYSQMASSEEQIANILEGGFESDKIGGQVGARMATSDWWNWAAPAEAQQYAQATEQWAEAYLRLKTGAATNKDEIRRNARTYFPQVGDEAPVVKQKNDMRAKAIEDVRRAAGRGAQGAPAGTAPKKPEQIKTPSGITLTPVD